MTEIQKSFWLNFEHEVSVWQTSEGEQTKYEQSSWDKKNMISSSNDDLKEARKETLQSWVENKVYIQVPGQGQDKFTLI